MQSQSRSDTYDVCVIGSGAGGGMAAHTLTKAGARVALLEAGQMWDPVKDGAIHVSANTKITMKMTGKSAQGAKKSTQI